MAKISFFKVETAFDKKSDWQVIGGLWPHKSKPDTFVGKIGLKVADKAGKQSQLIDSIVLHAGDALMIKPVVSATARAPKYRILVIEGKAPVSDTPGAKA